MPTTEVHDDLQLNYLESEEELFDDSASFVSMNMFDIIDEGVLLIDLLAEKRSLEKRLTAVKEKLRLMNGEQPSCNEYAWRTKLTTQQRTTLIFEYNDNAHPSMSRQNELANDLNLSPKVISNWFTNRRKRNPLQFTD